MPLRLSMTRTITSTLCVGALIGFGVSVVVCGEQPDVHATIVAPATVAAGASAKIVVELTVGAGWHVNSHAPHEKFLIPTDVALDATVGVVSAVRYPPGGDRKFAFSDEPMSVYEGTVRFEADLAVPSGASGNAAISGHVSFQACNDRQCFPPAQLPLSANVAVGASHARRIGGAPSSPPARTR
jgi:DsbC/DsbD-like thiol-disulfide interchange protein